MKNALGMSAVTGSAALSTPSTSAAGVADPLSGLSAADFYRPLIHVLATLSDYRAGVPVSMDAAVAQVSEIMGVEDLQDATFTGNKRKKVRRWIQWAFRNHRAAHTSDPTTKAMGRGLWALTPKGVDLARQVEADFAPKALNTAQWFEVQIRDKNLARRCAWIMRRRHPMESIEDLLSHVGLWFAIWGSKGHCDEYIQEGRAPALSVLVKWLEHKWNHQEYRRAKDALHRETGKRTQSEIRHRTEQGIEDYVTPLALKADPNAPEMAIKGSTATADHEEDYEFEWVDKTPDPLGSLYHDDRLSLARDVIGITRGRSSDRYVRFLDHLLEGRSKSETAALEGCSELRVSHLFQRVRDDLKKAPLMIEVALKVLALISDEPWSTQEEIAEEIPDHADALTLLRLRGLISEGSGRAFAPTDAGRTAVALGSLG